ncbi:MAG: 5'/3'-nucleotidase SurE [Clostridia bacterium]|nr:5'/3'-nucleotidase SurE [Clostridia bacterium]
MKILITNDDGINAPGIRLLADWAKKLGEVTVVAPKVEQSAMSHAIDFVNPQEIKRVEFIDGVTAYSMSSTPADCVRFGVLGLQDKFDLVLSGINYGVNVGQDIVYSGTVAAVFEAARLGIKGIAFSTFPRSQKEAAQYFDMAYDFIVSQNLFDETLIYNVNIPDKVSDIRITRQGSHYFSDGFVHDEGDMYHQEGEPVPDVCPNDLNRDTVAILNQTISVTPLIATRTDMAVFEKYKR